LGVSFGLACEGELIVGGFSHDLGMDW
jgi:hypothetical protein